MKDGVRWLIALLSALMVIGIVVLTMYGSGNL